MTQHQQKVEKIKIWGEYIGTHDSTWGCIHMLQKIAKTHFLVLRARLEDLRYYVASRLRGESRVTMVTIDLTSYPRFGLALQKTEKPLYLCPRCQAALLRRTPHSQRATIRTYPRA